MEYLFPESNFPFGALPFRSNQRWCVLTSWIAWPVVFCGWCLCWLWPEPSQASGCSLVDVASCLQSDWMQLSLGRSSGTWRPEWSHGESVLNTHVQKCASVWSQDEDTGLSLRVSFEFFTLGVVGASFFIIGEEDTAVSHTALYTKLSWLGGSLVLTLKAASIWALRMLHLRWSGSIAGEAGGCRDFSDSCFSSPWHDSREEDKKKYLSKVLLWAEWYNSV